MQLKRPALALTMAALGLFSQASWCRTVHEQNRAPAPAATSTDSLMEPAPGNAAATYSKGLLTVKARNARLNDVLGTICKVIGAQFQGAPNADAPFSGTLGPAPAAEIVISLLRGSGLSYAMGRSADPTLPASVTIVPRTQEPGIEAPPATRPALVANAQPDASPVGRETTLSETGTRPSVDDGPSKAQLALLAKLEQLGNGGGSSGDQSDGDVQRDSGVRQPHKRPWTR